MMMPILLLLILLLTAGVMFYQKREKSGKILIPVIVLIPIMVSALLWFLWIVFMAVFVGPYLESGTTTGFHNLGTIAYEVKSCIDGVDPYSLDNIQNTTVTSSWMDNNSLQINTQVGVLCGGENVTAINTRTLGNTLLLSYTSKRDNEYTRCVCAKELIITISDIEKKDYDIEWE